MVSINKLVVVTSLLISGAVSAPVAAKTPGVSKAPEIADIPIVANNPGPENTQMRKNGKGPAFLTKLDPKQPVNGDEEESGSSIRKRDKRPSVLHESKKEDAKGHSEEPKSDIEKPSEDDKAVESIIESAVERLQTPEGQNEFMTTVIGGLNGVIKGFTDAANVDLESFVDSNVASGLGYALKNFSKLSSGAKGSNPLATLSMLGKFSKFAKFLKPK